MKSTIRNSVGETYTKNNNNNNYQFNKNLDRRNNNNMNTSNNINVSNMMNSNNNSHANKMNVNMNDSYDNLSNKVINTSNNFFYILLFIIFASIIGLIIYFKDRIFDYINNMFENKKMKKDNDELEELRKKLNDKDKEINDIKMNDKIKNDKKEDESSNKKNNDEMKKIYTEKQFVKENSFCYIGDDDNMRHCIEAYNGDICESGDVYKRIDECLMPKNL